ncbi:MAG: cysteine-rich CWC family protein [Ramlibacter sp.]|nr:cysteine-rich CWC family protein [Ramlibacter sp.]MBX3659570.1 cysteine-rich CWC family protein [Ramlibacter sp.]
MSAAAAPDPSRCPLCGETNQCAMQVQRLTGLPQEPCWCTRVDFAPALLARVPEAARRQACICHRCATAPTPAHEP